MVTLGQEVVAPYVKPDAAGAPMFQLAGPRAGQPLPYLGYAPGAYLGQMVTPDPQAVGHGHPPRPGLRDRHGRGLKAMALEGHGIAFLPHSAVKKELRARKLVSAAPPELSGLDMLMDVRAYREKPAGKVASKSTAQALWEFLVSRQGGRSGSL
jgi:DNA-binding transcriptional LysR family regulator